MKPDDDRDDLKEEIRDQFAEYAEMLVEMLKDSKDLGPESEIHKTLFGLYGESLCYRDELDAYVSSKCEQPSRSLLHCESLDNYDSVFAYLALPPTVSPDKCLEDGDGSLPGITMSASCYELLRRYLRMFGKLSCTGSNCETQSWTAIASALFPDIHSDSLRRSYYKYQNMMHKEHHFSEEIPRRWTFDEDFSLVSCIETHGRGDRGIHETYLALKGSRSHDDIVLRVGEYFARLKREYKNRKVKKHHSSVDDTTRVPSPDDDGGLGDDSSWSEDHTLLG